jgi:hypothetical protein
MPAKVRAPTPDHLPRRVVFAGFAVVVFWESALPALRRNARATGLVGKQMPRSDRLDGGMTSKVPTARGGSVR